MTLTTDEMNMIIVDYETKRDPPRVTGPEAAEYLTRYERLKVAAKRDGFIVDAIINEQPDPP